MKIVSLETLRPAIQPNLLFVLLATDEGLVGLGEAFFGARTVEAYLHETVSTILFDMEDPSPEGVSIALRSYLGYQGAGAETRGNAAVELALWDLLGKSTGSSLAELLGGPVRTTLRTYNTCAGPDYVRATTQQSSANWGLKGTDAGLWEDLHSFLTRPADLARELLGEGITAMKVWPFDRAAERSNGTDINNAELDAALEVIAEIRGATGDRMDVMVELHGLWLRPPATKIMRALEPYRPFWVEDPIRPDAVEGLVQLRRDVRVPIATGETAVGRRAFAPLLAAGVVDYVTVDVQWTGGIGEARKVAALADAYAVPLAPHDCTGPATLAACAALTASQPNGMIQETVRAFMRTWYSELVTGLPVVEGSAMQLVRRPGHGVELRPEVLESPTVARQVSRR